MTRKYLIVIISCILTGMLFGIVSYTTGTVIDPFIRGGVMGTVIVLTILWVNKKNK